MIKLPTEAILDTLTRRGWAKHGDGDLTPDGTDPVCLHGAIRLCMPQPCDAALVEAVANWQGWGTDWNDRETTSELDVAFAILAHMEITDDELRVAFGPQWEHVVAFVRRAAVLTLDEFDRFYDVVGSYYRLASQSACTAVADAGSHVYDTASDVIAITMAYAPDSSYVAARNAVRALALRHEVRPGGPFTQEHYELLTAPWRAVIGPVHPDD